MAEPLPICYLNGAYLPLREARISPLDRGFLFADGVYEVLPVHAGHMFRFREHFDRLARNLAAIRLAAPHTHGQWLTILDELVRRNRDRAIGHHSDVEDMYLYVQVTRGAEYSRNHSFPAHATPSVFAMAAPLPTLSEEERLRGCAAITIEDFRWGRCDIKSTALLANVLMKQQAVDAGAQEAIIVREGEVLEGASSNVFVVSGGCISTPPDSPHILPGVTRDTARLLTRQSLPVQARRIGVAELRSADEVWISASTRDVLAVTMIDGQPVGSGVPGPLWKRMYEAFRDARSNPLFDTGSPPDTRHV